MRLKCINVAYIYYTFNQNLLYLDNLLIKTKKN